MTDAETASVLFDEVERLREIERAASDLLADVKRRYPGEDLRCPYMQKLDALISGMRK